MHVPTSLFACAAAAVLATALIAAPSTAANGGRPLATDLTGAAEVPGPGDPDASGTAHLALNQGQERICFDLAWADVDGTVTAAHIHIGAADEAGGVVVPLFAGSFAGTDSISDCVEVDRALVKQIRQDSAAYYVNVHSTEYPPGAIRGQLG